MPLTFAESTHLVINAKNQICHRSEKGTIAWDVLSVAMFTLCCNCMSLPKSKDGPIQAGHNNGKGEVDNVWEKTRWNPEPALKFNPMKLNLSEEV